MSGRIVLLVVLVVALGVSLVVVLVFAIGYLVWLEKFANLHCLYVLIQFTQIQPH